MAKLLFFVRLSLVLGLGATALGQGQGAKPENPAEAFVLERFSTKISFNADGTGTRETTRAIRVLSDAGVQQMGLLNFSFAQANEDLEVVYVRVRKPDGSLVATPEQNIQEMPAEITRQAPFYSDIREKHVAVRGLAAGDTLEFQVIGRLTKPQVPGHFWFEHNFMDDAVVKSEDLEVRLPADKPVQVKSLKAQPTVKQEGAWKVYTWKTSHPEMPQPKKRNRLEKPEELPLPDVQVTTFQSWEEIARWYGGLQRERVAVTPEIRAKALEITKGLNTNEERLQALYAYVSTKFRYIGLAFGVGRYQPNSAGDVLANGYGDCKDKHTLLASLLQAVGIQASPALINAFRRSDPEVPSPAQFNHLITVVDEGGRRVWLDTTPEVAPFGMLLQNLRDREALVIAAGGPARLQKTPADPPFPGKVTWEATAKLAEDGTLTGSVERTFRGDFEVALRAGLRNLARSQWQEFVQQISYGSGFAGEVSNVEASAPEDTRAPLRIRYEYTRKNYSDWENRHTTPPLPPMNLLEMDETVKLAGPISLGPVTEFVGRATLELPKGYKLTPPTAVEVKQDFAEYHAQYRVVDGVLTTEKRLRIKLREIPATREDDYRAFQKAIAADDRQFLDLEDTTKAAEAKPPEKKETAEPAKNPEAERLFGQAREAMQRGDTASGRNLLNRVIELDPKYPDAWWGFAVLESMQGRPDEAIRMMKKEIENYPEKERLYTILAEMQARSNRSAEEIETWQKLLKVSPDHLTALNRLAGLQMREKRYAEAVETLKKVVARDEKNARSHLALAQACLMNGQKELGLAEVNKAVELEDSEGILNDAAYYLAEANIELPRAKQYAERAVAAVERKTNTVTLPTLKLDDVRRMFQLYSYWDTLGWAYFQTGEMVKAEQYLKAGWALSQDSTVGDHLAQVYEKQGKPADALRMYDLAIASHTDDVGETTTRRERLAKQHPKAARPLNWRKIPGQTGMIVMGGASEELGKERTLKLARIPGGQGSAEFFVALVPGVNGASRVDEVRFVSGAESLRKGEGALKAARFPQPFPAGSAGKIVRRGILMCTSKCDFVLLPLTSVQSVE